MRSSTYVICVRLSLVSDSIAATFIAHPLPSSSPGALVNICVCTLLLHLKGTTVEGTAAAAALAGTGTGTGTAGAVATMGAGIVATADTAAATVAACRHETVAALHPATETGGGHARHPLVLLAAIAGHHRPAALPVLARGATAAVVMTAVASGRKRRARMTRSVISSGTGMTGRMTTRAVMTVAL